LNRKIQALRSSTKVDYLKAEIFSKFVSKDTDPPLVRRQRAIDKWLLTEELNAETEERLILTPDSYNIMPRVTFLDFVQFCRNLIIEIIGETAPIEALIGGFSGGASTSRPRTESHPAGKYLGKAHVTARCLDVFDLIKDEMPGWLADRGYTSIEVVPGNVMFTVPKKTDIDRVAAKEPDLNMFIQKGIGNYLSSCLRRIGINLNDQSNNRKFAHIGSVTNSLSTFDLSSASDSITTELVQQLLPECWYTLLDAVRCQVTIIDGEEHRNHMISSMGNGFTFELESLIFYVLTRAICYFDGVRGIVSIYGDDIICPSGISDILPSVFKYFGFTINLEKSHTDGPFRESCGGHYHNGFDITPFYVKAPIERLMDVIHVANQLRVWSSIEGLSVLNPEVEDIWLWLKSFVPRHLWGGDGISSGKFQLVSYDPSFSRLALETKRKSNGEGGYYHWLNATWDRESLRDGVSTSSRTTDLNRYRVRKLDHSAVPALPALFLHEIR